MTCGVGFELSDLAAAIKLPFRSQINGNLACLADIGDCFRRVSAMSHSKLPGYYKDVHSVILNDADIASILLATVQLLDEKLQQDYPEYEFYPDAVKLALLDMEYNLGDAELRKGYPHFDAAVNAQNWSLAAEQCGRDVSDPAFAARNAWTKQQFLSAV